MNLPPAQTGTGPDGSTIGFRHLEGSSEQSDIIIAIHGFTGDSTTMFPLIEASRGSWPALLVDVIGHGASSAPEHLEHYTMASVVDQILALIGPREPGTVHLVGYSMGGRIALSMAARAPWFFASVSTISATAGIEDPAERSQRYDLDNELALELEQLGVAQFVQQWLEQPLFSSYVAALSSSEYDQTVSQRSAQSARGLANSLRATGTGAMPPLWTSLQGLRSPLLAIAGELDTKFVEIAERLGATAPNGRTRIVSGAGHVVHVENLDEVSSALAAHLKEYASDGDYGSSTIIG